LPLWVKKISLGRVKKYTGLSGILPPQVMLPFIISGLNPAAAQLERKREWRPAYIY